MKEHNSIILEEKAALRQEELKRYKTIAYFILLMIVSVLIVLTIIKILKTNSKAYASLNGEYVYTSVMVEEGDTVYSLFKRYSATYPGSMDSFIKEVRSINNLDIDNIYAGEYIVIPILNSLQN